MVGYAGLTRQPCADDGADGGAGRGAGQHRHQLEGGEYGAGLRGRGAPGGRLGREEGRQHGDARGAEELRRAQRRQQGQEAAAAAAIGQRGPQAHRHWRYTVKLG